MTTVMKNALEYLSYAGLKLWTNWDKLDSYISNYYGAPQLIIAMKNILHWQPFVRSFLTMQQICQFWLLYASLHLW